jgi:hypothetical protein
LDFHNTLNLADQRIASYTYLHFYTNQLPPSQLLKPDLAINLYFEIENLAEEWIPSAKDLSP